MDWNAVRKMLRGPGALVSTVFRDDLELDTGAIERNVRSMVDRGFGDDGGFLISPCGDGEYVTLNVEEMSRVVRAARAGSDGKLAVVAGVNSADFRHAAKLAEAARAEGAVAVMMSPPIYYALNEDAIFDWYERFARSVDIGIMLYEQSFRGPSSNAGIRPDLVGRLLEIPNVVAIKHIGLFALAEEFTIIDRYGKRFNYIDSSGGYATTAAHMHGAAGWVTEIAPIWPEFEMRYWRLLEAGDYREAELHRARVAPLFQFVMDNPATNSAYSWISVLKAALEYVGLEGGPVRPPFRALNDAERRPLFALLERLELPRKGRG